METKNGPSYPHLARFCKYVAQHNKKRKKKLKKTDHKLYILDYSKFSMVHPNKKFMEIAIQEAIKSAEKEQYALGAVVVLGDKVISIAHTNLHETNDPSSHAEMNAIRKLQKK